MKSKSKSAKARGASAPQTPVAAQATKAELELVSSTTKFFTEIDHRQMSAALVARHEQQLKTEHDKQQDIYKQILKQVAAVREEIGKRAIAYASSQISDKVADSAAALKGLFPGLKISYTYSHGTEMNEFKASASVYLSCESGSLSREFKVQNDKETSKLFNDIETLEGQQTAVSDLIRRLKLQLSDMPSVARRVEGELAIKSLEGSEAGQAFLKVLNDVGTAALPSIPTLALSNG